MRVHVGCYYIVGLVVNPLEAVDSVDEYNPKGRAVISCDQIVEIGGTDEQANPNWIEVTTHSDRISFSRFEYRN
jgi:hypothetical protein